MSRHLLFGLVALVLAFSPLSARAGSIIYAESDVSPYPIEAVAADGSVSTFASTDWDQHSVGGLAFDSSGNLFVSTSNFNNVGTIIKIAPNGTVSTFATGFVRPMALAFDSSGDLYVDDWGAGSIFGVTPSGSVRTVATGFGYLTGMAIDTWSGNLYVGNLTNEGMPASYPQPVGIDEITPSGTVTPLFSQSKPIPTYGQGIAFDSCTGNLYCGSQGQVDGVYNLSEITTGGVVSTFSTGINEPCWLAFDSSGNLYVNGAGGMQEITPTGSISTLASEFDVDDAIAVRSLAPGDANGDGKVDINDLTIVLANYNKTGMAWNQGEFTGSGTVDINDLTIVLANYNTTSGTSIKAVPEPASLLLVAIGVFALLLIRRRGRG